MVTFANGTSTHRYPRRNTLIHLSAFIFRIVETEDERIIPKKPALRNKRVSAFLFPSHSSMEANVYERKDTLSRQKMKNFLCFALDFSYLCTQISKQHEY